MERSACETPMATTRGTSKAKRSTEKPPSAKLERYQKKRNFSITPEPAGAPRRRKKAESLRFVIQKHWARRLHYDFRLELDGVLLSWAVPKGPSYDPSEKRMAVHTEDHPLDYASFEGEIPAKQYGAGSVIVWDRGTWEPVGDPRDGIAAGKLLFDLYGEKLAGRWELVRIAKPLGPLTQASLNPTEIDANETMHDAPLAPLPAKLVPQLASLSPTLPADTGWIIETKFDGYRMLARIEDAHVTLFTRNGHDWTLKLKSLASEIEKLDISEGWLDGEIVVLRDWYRFALCSDSQKRVRSVPDVGRSDAGFALSRWASSAEP